jgi:hypothetical protein
LGGRDSSGAGLFNDNAEVMINNSTFDGNHKAGGPAGFGGGIYNAAGTVTINNSTITGQVGELRRTNTDYPAAAR